MRAVVSLLVLSSLGCAVGDEDTYVAPPDAAVDVSTRADLDLRDDALVDAAAPDLPEVLIDAAESAVDVAPKPDVFEETFAPFDASCMTGETMCLGGCVNLTSSTGHCGMCGNACIAPSDGTVTCTEGVCVPRCPSGREACGSACVDRQSDGANCGVCGHACVEGERCMSGRCLGPSGYRVQRGDSAASWIDACAQPKHQTLLTSSDEGTARLVLPFPFRYWGVGLAIGAPVIVSVNGYLTFQEGAPTPPDGIIPNTVDRVNAVIAAQWRNLRTRGNGLCVALVGNDVGSRRWAIQWSDARYFTSDLSHLNFEIVLNEASNTIDLVYASQTLPEPATVALEDWEGARSSVPFSVPQPILFSNNRARFVPE